MKYLIYFSVLLVLSFCAIAQPSNYVEIDHDTDCGCYIGLWSQNATIFINGVNVEWSAQAYLPYSHPPHLVCIKTNVVWYNDGTPISVYKGGSTILNGSLRSYKPAEANEFSYTINGFALDGIFHVHYEFLYESDIITF